jgi:hypothetical protein
MVTIIVAMALLTGLTCALLSPGTRCFVWSFDGGSSLLRIVEPFFVPVLFLAILSACLPLILRRWSWWHAILVVPIVVVLTGIILVGFLRTPPSVLTDTEDLSLFLVFLLVLFLGFQLSHLVVYGIDRLTS